MCLFKQKTAYGMRMSDGSADVCSPISYEQQFEGAQRTLLDVLDAENELFTSEGQLITAQTNEQLASYRILAVGGLLMETLGVTAPEQAVVEHKSWIDGLTD